MGNRNLNGPQVCCAVALALGPAHGARPGDACCAAAVARNAAKVRPRRSSAGGATPPITSPRSRAHRGQCPGQCKQPFRDRPGPNAASYVSRDSNQLQELRLKAPRQAGLSVPRADAGVQDREIMSSTAACW